MATPWSVMIKAVIGAVVILLFAFFLIAGLLAGAQSEREKKAQSLELQQAVAANDPVRFAKALVPGADAAFEGNRNPQTGLIDRFSTLTVTYSLDPVPDSNRLARNAFFRRVSEIVPAVFERFDHIEVVVVKGTAMMVDVRGHERVDEVASVTFADSSSRGVNWPNVKPENVPRLANKHYLHPRLVSDLAASDPVRATSRKDRPRRNRGPVRAEPELGSLELPIDKLVDRFNETAAEHQLPVRLAFERCNKIGFGRMCHYRLARDVKAIAFAMNQPDEITVLTVFAGVQQDAIQQWGLAMAVATYLFSPTASGEERLLAVSEIVKEPKPVKTMLHGVVYEAFVHLQLTGRVKRPK